LLLRTDSASSIDGPQPPNRRRERQKYSQKGTAPNRNTESEFPPLRGSAPQRSDGGATKPPSGSGTKQGNVAAGSTAQDAVRASSTESAAALSNATSNAPKPQREPRSPAGGGAVQPSANGDPTSKGTAGGQEQVNPGSKVVKG
jgi:hypothetical protein